MRAHPDGSFCKEGTRAVPPEYEPCCPTLAGHLATCEYDLRYEWWSGDQVWVIAIADSAGGGGVVIQFCPHCGRKLRPESQDDEDEPSGGQPGRRLRIG
jgi:hypothetical protein